jgi:hypothetical protein
MNLQTVRVKRGLWIVYDTDQRSMADLNMPMLRWSCRVATFTRKRDAMRFVRINQSKEQA